MNWMLVSQIALWLMMLIQLLLMLYLMKYVGQFLYRLRLTSGGVEENQLKIGQLAPLFRAKGQDGGVIRLAEHNHSMTLLVFASDTCPVCHEVLEQLPPYIKSFDVRVIIITKERFVLDDKIGYGDLDFYIIESKEIFESYFINTIPYLILINSNNIIEGTFRQGNISSLNEVLKYNSNRKRGLS